MDRRSADNRPCRLMSVTELRAWLAERGVLRSREELQRRAREGQYGQLVGKQYIVTEQEAQALLEALRPQDS